MRDIDVTSGLIGGTVASVLMVIALICVGFDPTDLEMQVIGWSGLVLGLVLTMWLEHRRFRSHSDERGDSR